MSVAVGAHCYGLGSAPCTGAGLSWTEDELEAAINGPVSALVFDDEGSADIASLLTGLVETEFEQEGLARVLASPDKVEDWRVGEAIAETYLTDHHGCTFPWPDGRDERKNGSSLPGADLVGLHADESGDCFAFGEVKTSSEAKYPPQAMYGRTGLKQQIEDLREQVAIRDSLMKYLGYRAVNASWQPRYQAASKRYLANSADVRLFGVLVRDVAPHQDDLRVRVEKLASECPDGTTIELLSIYLPGGSVAQLAAKAVAAKKGGSA